MSHKIAKRDVASDLATAYVVAAVKGKTILNYYVGDGEWGYHDYAKVSRTLTHARQLKKEARETMPIGATDLAIFSCWVDA